MSALETYNTAQVFTSDGVQTIWDFSFSGGYIDKSHVKATYTSPSGVKTPVVVTDSMFIGPFQLNLTPPVATGFLTIYRETPRAVPLVDFSDGARITESSLDTVARQSVFIAAELLDQLLVQSAPTPGSAAALEANLGDITSALKNAGMVKYLGTLSYAPGTIGHKMKQMLSVLDAPYSADPTGAVESAPAFASALATGKLVYRPKGAYTRNGAVKVYPSDGFEGVLWVGDNNLNNSDDPQIVVSRNVDSSGSGNAHSFTDSSIYTRSGISHNSYDDRTRVVAPGSTEHHASYQVGTEYAIAGGGTFGNHYGYVNTVFVMQGVLTNHITVQMNAPVITGSGQVVNCYGMYAPLGYGKGGPGFNQSTGVVNFFTNESHAMAYSLGPVVGADGVIAGDGAGTSYTPVKTFDAVTSAGKSVGLRLQQLGTQIFDLEIPANEIYATFSNVAGRILKFNADRSIVFKGVAAVPAMNNEEWSASPISDTQFQISYKGSDGQVRKHILSLTL